MASIEKNSNDEFGEMSAEEVQAVEIARCERVFAEELNALIAEFRYEFFVTYGQMIGVLQQKIMDLHLESRHGDNDRDTSDSN